jgi:hypothetical protein
LQNNAKLNILIFLGIQRHSHCIEINCLQVPWRRQNIMFWFGLAPSIPFFLFKSLMVISDLFFGVFFFVYHREDDYLLLDLYALYSL